MSRPLLNLSLDQLAEIAKRNQDTAAELDLIRSELSHRNSSAARRLRSLIEQRLAELKTKERRGYTTQQGDTTEMGTRHTKEISEEARAWANEAIAKLRAKLIDLSRRSPLVSFKHGSRSASMLRIVDECPDLLFEALTNGSVGFEPLPGEDETPPDEKTPEFQIAYEKARLTDELFQRETEDLGDEETDVRAWQQAERALRARVRGQLGLPKLDYGKGIDIQAVARLHGFDPSYELRMSDDGSLEEHHEDDSIRVLLTRKELDKRLKTIWDRAGTHLRETGLHTLFLAIGFVQWFEDDASDIPNHAPLLLLPMALDREVKRGRYEYRLRALEDGLEVNVALIEKAREHWGLQLPELRVDETPESYFIRVAAILAMGRRLSFKNFMTLAVLPPMILWKDLDPENWPKDAFAKHRLLPGLVGATKIEGSDSLADTIDIDDPVNEAMVPALITDADASQHGAIIDMAAGKDLAIEGPPGTGKSQTITNMIATALAQGKRVLFVAEKQAALRVVSDRLRTAGFGPLLLELHGERANRTEVYDGIRERLNARAAADEVALSAQRDELRRHRSLIRRYLGLIRTSLGRTGSTAHQLAWREILLRQRFEESEVKAMAARWQPEAPLDLSPADLKQKRESLDQFGKALLALEPSDDSEERTFWAVATKLDAFDRSDALSAAGQAARDTSNLGAVVEKLEGLGLGMPGPNGPIRQAADQLAVLEPFVCNDERILLCAIRQAEVSADLISHQAAWSGLREQLTVSLKQPEAVMSEEAIALRYALAIERGPDDRSSLNAELRAFENLQKFFQRHAAELDALTERTRSGPNLNVADAGKVVAAFEGLAHLPPNGQALLSIQLTDPLISVVVDRSVSECEALRTERTSLTGTFTDEAFECEEAELENAAETLNQTGVFGRLFSSQYRAAKRRSAQLLRDERERQETADALRRLVRFKRKSRMFAEQDKAKHLFPPVLWEGIDSDFAALQAAGKALNQALSDLQAIDEADTLRDWLMRDQQSRVSFVNQINRIRDDLSRAGDGGFGAKALSELPVSLTERIADLALLEDSLANVGAKDDVSFTLNGERLDVALLKFIETKCEFDRIAALDGFEWVGGPETPLGDLALSLEEIRRVVGAGGPMNIPAIISAQDSPGAYLKTVISFAGQLAKAVTAWSKSLESLNQHSGVLNSLPRANQDWPTFAKMLAIMSEDAEGASLVADMLKYSQGLADQGLSAFADAALAGEQRPDMLPDLLELLSASAALRNFLGGDGVELGRLGSLTLDEARRSFKKIDKHLHQLEGDAIIAARLADRPPMGVGHGRRSEYTEFELVNHEVGLKRPRTPMRDVVHRAGAAMQSLKPVWMMSPTSVAQYIQPGKHSFDLLIVDEASQMRPEFSLSSILRADQFVVVGDANQLPPSDHFQTANTNDDDNGVGIDENTESILDLANQKFRQKRRLRWHYRSQHESLIQFSNQEFYERDLVVFPSPSGNGDELLGVKCIYVPDMVRDAFYDSSINQREAEKIIEEAFGLMRSHPERSIGIVAMNAKQTELIKNEFDRLILEEDHVREYVESFAGTIDEFFIKNLENVQGDERDVILISTVYGPDRNGNVRQNFGLLNREVGWRRLNVLVTRAKMSCRVVTSLRPEDIKITENASKGLLAFKSYLTYVHGGAQYQNALGGEPDSDFEIFVADALRGAGYEVVYQVGVAGFRIDLGVKHPAYPAGFIAGIECDGASYHSGLSVRDRDHIRQSVLENMGWNIYRVWSTDWFQDSARETAKLVRWVEFVKERLVRELPGAASSGQEFPEPEHPSSKSEVNAQALDQVLPVQDDEHADGSAEIVGSRTPRGRELRKLGDFEWYEAIRGQLYEIWMADKFAGEVEVLRRATASPRLYGDHVLTAQSEYEGRVQVTGDVFSSFDLFAAVREVADRAQKSDLLNS